MGEGKTPVRPLDPPTIIRQQGLRLRKKLGQHFLLSERTLERIVNAAEVSDQDVVLEIGTGLGRLTERLALRADRVISVEIAPDLLRLASQRLAALQNVRLLCCDFLHGKHAINPAVTEAVREALHGTSRGAKVVSNLPYCISSPAVICLLEWEVPVEGIFVTLQTDVADRLTAQVGSAQYGPLTVSVNYWGAVGKLFSLAPGAFWPRPKVASSFVAIIPSPPPAREHSYQLFSEAVNTLFQNRRKTLSHALRIGWDKEAARAILRETGLPPSARPQELRTSDFLSIANVLLRRQK